MRCNNVSESGHDCSLEHVGKLYGGDGLRQRSKDELEKKELHGKY